MSEDPSSNTQDDNNSAIYSSGGFSVQQDFPNIGINDTNISTQYNVADALQIKYSLGRINSKIGVIKDDKDENTIFSEYDVSNDTLINDEVTITAEELLDYLTPDRVISM